MKIFNLLFAGLLLSVAACNSENQNNTSKDETTNEAKKDDKKTNVDVPASVRSTFEQNNPGATDVEWDNKGDEFKVDFRINGEKNTLKYNKDGKQIKSEMRIDKAALPASVTKVVASEYAGYSIEKADEINEDGKGKQYEVELKKGDEVVDVHFTADGKVIKKDPEEKKKDKQ
ncbi:MAG: PepSY-like domain-containing protein [Chitinophagaceae bacterium]